MKSDQIKIQLTSKVLEALRRIFPQSGIFSHEGPPPRRAGQSWLFLCLALLALAKKDNDK